MNIDFDEFFSGITDGLSGNPVDDMFAGITAALLGMLVLFFLSGLVVVAIVIVILYFVIKGAVTAGILRADQLRARRAPEQYPNPVADPTQNSNQSSGFKQ